MESKTKERVMWLMFAGERHGKVCLIRVCQKAHRAGNMRCKMKHCVPNDALWFGTYPKDEIGDLRSDFKEQCKQWRKDSAQWLRECKKLNEKRAAPAFAAYLESLREGHAKAKPEFVFKPRG